MGATAWGYCWTAGRARRGPGNSSKRGKPLACRMMPAASGCAVRLSPERECPDCAGHGDVLHYSNRDDERQPRERPHSSLARTRRFHPRDRRRRPARGPSPDRRHPLPARSRTATSTSATPSRSASTSASPASSAAAATCASTTPTPPRKSRSTSTSIQADVRWLGFDWGEHLYFASDYFEQLYEWAVDLIKAGKAYVDDLSADEIREHRGTLTEPGRESPWRDRPVAGEPRPLRAHARRRVPRRRARAAGEDRHGLAQHQPARPGAVPDPPRGASAHRRRLVHLPDVRLRPRAVGRHRGHHPLHLHARVRGPPAALRLAHRQPAGAFAPAPVRVRAAQPDATPCMSQAHAAAAGRRGPRARLGRPAHADHLGPAPARLSRRGDPRLRGARSAWPRSDSVVEVEMLEHAVRDVLNRQGAAPLRRARPLRVVIENYPRGRSRRWRSPNNPEDPSAGTAPGALRARALDRARRLHGGPAEQVLPPGPRPRGAAALGLLRDLHARS